MQTGGAAKREHCSSARIARQHSSTKFGNRKAGATPTSEGQGSDSRIGEELALLSARQNSAEQCCSKVQVETSAKRALSRRGVQGAGEAHETGGAASSLTWSPLGLPGIQLVTVRRVKIAAIHSDFDRGDASVPDGIR